VAGNYYVYVSEFTIQKRTVANFIKKLYTFCRTQIFIAESYTQSLHIITSYLYYQNENDERYQLDATIVIYYHKLSLHISGIYAHLQEYRLYVAEYGVQHCKRELGVNGWSCSVLFVVLCSCSFWLCCRVYWVRVPHNIISFMIIRPSKN
jgi:hypothetical protein